MGPSGQAPSDVERPPKEHQCNQGGKVFAAGVAEQVGVLGQDPLAGQQRVHVVLDRCAQVHERRAVAGQIT